jgi:hypothetical protein
MYYVGTSFNPANGGYKTIQNAKKAADKINANVYDESGVVVYPTIAADSSPTETMAQNGAEMPDNISEGNFANEAESDDSGAHSEKESYSDSPDADALREATGGQLVEPAAGTVTVTRDGMIAIRNAASWEDGHKCGIAKTGYTARVTERINAKGGTLYKTESDKYISGKPEDTKFTPDE